MGYKLSFNTLNGGKGTLGLMKNWAFNSSMCDGLCIKYRVPPKVIETKLSFYYQYSKGANGAVFGDKPLKIELSIPVDEYITVMIKGYYMQEVGGVLGGQYIKHEVSDMAIIPPSQKTGYTSNAFPDGYTLSMLLIYVGKRTVYYSENETELAEFIDSYFGTFEKPINNLDGIKEEDIVGYPLKSLAESIYVYPLCKDKPVLEGGTNGEKLSLYQPAYRYKGEIYYPKIKITNNKNDNLEKILGGLPDPIADKIAEQEGVNKENVESENKDNNFNVDDFHIELPEIEPPIIDWSGWEAPSTEETEKMKNNSEDNALKDTIVEETKKVEKVNEETGQVEVVEETTAMQTIKVKVGNALWEDFKLGLKFLTGKYKNSTTETLPLRDKDGNIVDKILVTIDKDTGEYTAITENGTQGDLYVTKDNGFIFVTKDGLYISDKNGIREYKKTGEQTQYQYNPETDSLEEKKYDVYEDGSGVETWVEEGFWDEGPESPSGGDGEGGE